MICQNHRSILRFNYNKMDEKELLKERFRLAIASAVKVISENYELDIRFSNNEETKNNTLNLPELSEFNFQ